MFYTFAVLILFIIIFGVAILYIQIDIQLRRVKDELDLIVISSALKNCDKEALANYEYIFNIQGIKEDVSDIISYSFPSVEINNIDFDDTLKNFIVSASVEIEPLIKFKGNDKKTVELKKRVKFKNMEVINNNK